MTEPGTVPDTAPRRRGIRKGVYIIPSLFTTGNVVCGFYAVTESLHGAVAVTQDNAQIAAQHFDLGAMCIGLAVLFDFLDGRIARMTNSTTQFGVEFDSIADVLTFGIAPALLAYAWGYGFTLGLGKVAWAISFVYLICGALRLARFNVQASKPALQKPGTTGKVDKKAFVGMPIPAGAGLIAALVHFWPKPLAMTSISVEPFGQELLFDSERLSVGMLVIVAALGLLMVSTIRHTSFKNIGPRSRNPRLVIVAIALLVAVIRINSRWTLLGIATLYATHGVIGKLVGMFRHHGQSRPDVILEERISPPR